jgi:hypothetical protein
MTCTPVSCPVREAGSREGLIVVARFAVRYEPWMSESPEHSTILRGLTYLTSLSPLPKSGELPYRVQ